MKITFIHPNIYSHHSSDAMEPLVFSLLAGLTPPDVEVKLFDDRVEEIDFDDKTDLVALTVHTFSARRAYAIAARYREKGIPVVAGGIHPTLLPAETLLYTDAVVTGDAESAWPQVVEDARHGSLKRIYNGDHSRPLAGIIHNRSIFKGKKYVTMKPVQFGRGCRFACDFCAVHAFYGNTIRRRPVQEVISEIETLEKKFVFFVDDNLAGNHESIKELFGALIPLNVKWVAQVSVDTAYAPGLPALMAKSGCIAVFVGLESLNQANLKLMRKGENLKHDDYRDAVKRYKEHGIMVCGAFVFGYDYDTPDSIRRTLEFALETKLCIAHFNTLLPYPTTPLYERLEKEKRLKYQTWWISPEFKFGECLFQPRGMTADELTDRCFEARCKFNSYSAIARRALDPKANCKSLFHLSSFLAANLISRKEIHKRQGSTLG
jgi:radical SAM superfamily enzyme YgiQ (UPF0313 family)